jgi:hypothetical protein
LSRSDIVITLRPPASDAHYHNRLSDDLFHFAVDYLNRREGVRMVVLPRNARQAASLCEMWPASFSSGKIVMPEHAVDGLNLIWFSDLVISGGGTMNREAAALGVPVYSIFRGKIGAVDRYLAAEGRLTLVQSADDVKSKIRLVRREPLAEPDSSTRPALLKIVENLVSILELECHPNSDATLQ